MTQLRPKFITFDCYGTLTFFEISVVTRRMFADRLQGEEMDRFIEDFTAYRRDEVLGDWKPYVEVITSALLRTCKLWNLDYDDAEGHRLVK